MDQLVYILVKNLIADFETKPSHYNQAFSACWKSFKKERIKFSIIDIAPEMNDERYVHVLHIYTALQKVSE